MSWIMILLIWVLAPFAELGIIVSLCVSNSRYKRRIQELERMRRPPMMAVRPPVAEYPPAWSQGSQAEEYLPARSSEPQAAERPPVGSSEPLEAERPLVGSSEPQAAERPFVESPERQEAECPFVESPERQEAERPLVESPEPQAAEGDRPMVREKEPVKEECPPARDPGPVRPLSGSLGTISLILGVIFIVLAGLIFATTTWHVLGDVSKTLLVMACAALFFGASFMAEKVFSIHKTSNAFYILGSAFLFLTVLAAAYFKLLGPEFILNGRNRWKVLWAGSLVMEASFFGGLKRFDDKIYTQASLWGMSVSLFFLAKAFSVKWDGFVFMMTIYGLVLIVIDEYLENDGQKREGTLARILREGFCSFAPLHFWFFGGITLIRGLFAEGRMIAEGCTAGYSPFLDRFSLFTFTLPGLGAMAALVCGSLVLQRRKKTAPYSWMLRLVSAEMVLYGAGWITDDFIWRMAAVNVSFLILGRIWERNFVFWDICGCTALAVTLINFYSDTDAGMAGMILCLAAFALYYFRFYLGERQWPHLAAAAGILPFPLAAWSRLDLTFDQLGLGVGAALLVFGVLARCLHPIAEEDGSVQGGWRMDWFQILSALTILYMMAAGDERWRFVYILIAAVYVLQYTAVEWLKKPALSLSAFFLAAAFWQQPFVRWPEIVELEINLLPAAGFTWVVGIIWERNQWIRIMQTVVYMICLFLLCQDAFFSGQVADALMLEGICLAVFLRAQINNNMLWARVSGTLILLVVLFMTRDFWLSISWWVYLMAAGIGLIAFAAVTERKRR